MGHNLQQSLEDGRHPANSDEEYADGGIFDIDLRAVWGVVLRNAKWAALIVVGTVLAGLAVTVLIAPRYLASARILVENEGDQIIEGGDLQNQLAMNDTERFLQTQEQMVHSLALAQRVADAQKLATSAAFFSAFGETMPELEDIESGPKTAQALKAARSEKAVEILLRNLTTDLPPDSRIVTISFETTDPQLSANLANAYADGFIEMNLNRKFDSSSYARQFLASQLDAARTKVEASERDLNRYSRAAGLIRVGGQGDSADRETTLSVTNDALLQANQATVTAKADRIAAEGRWTAIANAPILSIPDVIQNPAIQGLTQQKAEIEAKLADERARHFDNYPTVKTLSAQIKELDSRINTVGNDIKKSIRLNYEAAIGREETMTQQVASLRSTALDEQDRGVQYSILKRVAETDRALYQGLLERYNQINAAAGAASNNVSLVDRAVLPHKPSSPKLFINLLIAGVLGIIIAGVFIFLREYFDDTIRSPDDVEAKLGLPLLGLVPVVDEAIGDALQDPRSHVSEAYQSLVTNLSYATANGLPRSLVVTSANEGEGKSTSALAIARDVAHLGKRVLLVDADLRRPTLHSRISNRNQPGLTELLIGKAKFEDVAVPSDLDNLTFMTALPMPVDPSRLLGSERFTAFVEEACNRYDLVVFDCPPMLGLSDTAAVSTHVDSVLFVTDASRFQRGAVKASLRRLLLVKANVVGVLLTKFDPKAGGSQYAYYGYSYYGYGTEKA
jgi:capsular exopolysaccharide synthesis family protein